VRPATRRIVFGSAAVVGFAAAALAWTRMAGPIRDDGLTRAGLVLGVLGVWLGLLSLLVLAAALAERGGWFPRSLLAGSVLLLLGLAVLNPDRYVADYDVAHAERTHGVAVFSLELLSADAAPALNALSGRDRACALDDIAWKVRHWPAGWAEYNVARARARQLIADLPEYGTDCEFG
jgi:hypothetical protein